MVEIQTEMWETSGEALYERQGGEYEPHAPRTFGWAGSTNATPYGQSYARTQEPPALKGLRFSGTSPVRQRLARHRTPIEHATMTVHMGVERRAGAVQEAHRATKACPESSTGIVRA